MIKHLLALPGGEELSSGTVGQKAIRSIKLTQSVNCGQLLTLGSVCAALLEAEIWAPEGLPLAPGQEVTLYQLPENGRPKQLGIFRAEKPVRKSRQVYKLTAYDRVRALDQDLSDWLAGLEGWPYTLWELAHMVCSQCGVALAGEEIPNGGYAVEKFSARGVTGRQLMQWIGEVAGRFCRATPQGQILLDWYAPNENFSLGASAREGIRQYYEQGLLTWESSRLQVSDAQGEVSVQGQGMEVAGEGAVTVTILDPETQLPCFLGQVQLEDYTVSPTQKVQLRQNEEDVGTVYPDIADGVQTYCITGNPLLSAGSAQALLPVARTLYEQLRQVAYTPCKAAIIAGSDVEAGQILCLTDREGKQVTAYVMSKVRQGGREILECTGSPTRQAGAAVNNQSFRALSGKVLNLRTDVDGLKAENKDTAGRMTRLELDLQGIRSQVADQNGKVTALEQTEDAIRISIGTVENTLSGILQDGTPKVATAMGYTLDDRGLQIRKAGEEISNLLDHTGMYVKRDEDIMLRADSMGVLATDVTVKNYLVIGEHARFEDYDDGSDGKRTACFHLGG